MNKCSAFLVYISPGIVITIAAYVLGWIVIPSVIRDKIIENVRLVDGSDTWEKWRVAPIPIYLAFYIHHIKNPDQVERGQTAIYEERGPFTYLQKRAKVDIKQDDGLNTVRYREVKTFHFDKERSRGNTENDLVNIPNIPFISIIHTIRKTLRLDIAQGFIGNYVLDHEPLIKRNVTVGDLLFKGFDVSKYTHSLLRSRLPKEFSGDRFGLYKGQNGTASEEWQIYTGYDNPINFGKVKSWDGRTELGYWRKHTHCDSIKGSDGSLFSPFIRKTTKLFAFSPEICRSISVQFVKEVEHRGIPAYRFQSPSDSLGSNEENKCFCLEDKIENCPYGGVLPLESCKQAPIWTSLPYFLDADIRYLAESGLGPPDREKHETFIDIEPTTGLVVRAHKRVQIGIEVQPSRKVRALQGLGNSKVLFPIMWADESAELDEVLAEDLKSQLLTPLKIVETGKWILLLVGTAVTLIGFVLYLFKYCIRSGSVAGRANGFGDLGREKSGQTASSSSVASSSSRTSGSTSEDSAVSAVSRAPN